MSFLEIYKGTFTSCEDSSVEYAQFDNVRFVFKDGDYVGWYAC